MGKHQRIEGRLLTRADAAAYCALSVPTFNVLCPVSPVRLGSGRRQKRFDRYDLDKWIDGLKGDEAKSDFDLALERLDDGKEEDRHSRH